MITIFHGRKLSLDGSKDVIYAQVAVALRDQIHHFNTGRNCNPFAVFMKIALHTDPYGWAFPSSASIRAGTGISTAHALAAARAHLLHVRIDGHRVLAIYHQRRPDGTFGRHLYRVFPDAWPDAFDHLPGGFAAESLSPVTPSPAGDPPAGAPPAAQPHAGGPHIDEPHADQPHADHPQRKKNQTKKNHTKENHVKKNQRSIPGSAGIESSTHPLQSPISNIQYPVPHPPIPHLCDLARFIAAHSRYRVPAGEQHERLLRPVPHVDGAHRSPDELYRDPWQREAFQAWVLAKIAWAEGDGGPRKPLKALVSAIRNYEHPQFGWLPFREHWPERGVTHGQPDPPAQVRDRQDHWAQVKRYLASAHHPLLQSQPRAVGTAA
jgi:hypothetical protein